MRILKLNSHGDDVAKWQQFLTGAGFKPGRVDGFFGDTTATATIAFQEKHGLTPDGALGNETLGKAMTLNFKPLPKPDDPEPDASPKAVATIAGIKVHKLGDGRAVFYTGGMMIDADGAYHAYHPANKGLECTNMSPITEAMKPSRNSDRQSCASSGELLPKNGTAFATESPTTFVSSRPTSFGSSRRAGISVSLIDVQISLPNRR